MITVIGDLTADILVNKKNTNFATDTDGNISFSPGGQANNVASWIAEQKVDCRFIGRVGNDPFGKYLIELLEKQGVHSSISIDPELQTGKIVILIDQESKERSMISDRGANLNLSKEDITDIEKSKLLYLSGYSLFAEKPCEAVYYAKEKAVYHNIPIALDPSSTYFLEKNKEEFIEFLSSINFLFPNYEEGCLLTGEKEPEKIIRVLKEMVPNPILKLGDRGCLLINDNELVHIPAKDVEVVDTTGAGDAFIGTFLATYLKTENILESAQLATVMAAKAVSKVGAWLRV